MLKNAIALRLYSFWCWRSKSFIFFFIFFQLVSFCGIACGFDATGNSDRQKSISSTESVDVMVGAVLFTLLVQGLSIKQLVRKLGLDQPTLADRMACLEGILSAKKLALDRIHELQTGGLFSHNIAENLRSKCKTSMEETHSQLETLRQEKLVKQKEIQLVFFRSFAEQFPEFVSSMQQRLAERMLIHAEREAIEKKEWSGTISHGVAESILEKLAKEVRQLRGRETGKLRVDASELLHKVLFFRDIPEEDFTKIVEKLRPRTIPAGKTIIRQGDTGDSLYLIARGRWSGFPMWIMVLSGIWLL